MTTQDTVRVWLQFPLGGSHAKTLEVAEVFRAAVGIRGSVMIHSDLEDALGMAIDVSPTGKGTPEPVQLGVIVEEACSHTMGLNPDAMLTWEAST